MSAVEGCPLRGVPLYSVLQTTTKAKNEKAIINQLHSHSTLGKHDRWPHPLARYVWYRFPGTPHFSILQVPMACLYEDLMSLRFPNGFPCRLSIMHKLKNTPLFIYHVGH